MLQEINICMGKCIPYRRNGWSAGRKWRDDCIHSSRVAPPPPRYTEVYTHLCVMAQGDNVQCGDIIERHTSLLPGQGLGSVQPRQSLSASKQPPALRRMRGARWLAEAGCAVGERMELLDPRNCEECSMYDGAMVCRDRRRQGAWLYSRWQFLSVLVYEDTAGSCLWNQHADVTAPILVYILVPVSCPSRKGHSSVIIPFSIFVCTHYYACFRPDNIIIVNNKNLFSESRNLPE